MSDEIHFASDILMMTERGRDFDKPTFYLIGSVGRYYQPAVLPADLRRGKPGDCYDCSAIQAAFSYMRNHDQPKYRYVEGWATDTDGIRHLHAWLTDQNGMYAYDPTWLALDNLTDEEVAPPLNYFGIEIDIFDVRLFIDQSDEHKALFANRHMAPEAVAQAIGAPIELVEA